MPPQDKASLLDILNAARLTAEFVGTMDANGLAGDMKTQSAVLHQLLIIGEATKRLSEDVRTRHDHIPWRLMAGMRDQLIHAYDGVDLQEVWRTVSRDIPQLVAGIEAIVLLPEN